MAGTLGKALYRTREWQVLRAACKRALRAVCVRTAADLVSSVTTSCRSTWAVRRFPPWPASCGCAGRVIFNDTHRGGAPRGTHYSLACAEVEWLPSCFRFGVGVVTITAHYWTRTATTETRTNTNQETDNA